MTLKIPEIDSSKPSVVVLDPHSENHLYLELDNEGYPTDESLEKIKSFNGNHRELMEKVACLFEPYGRCMVDGNTWKIATGGWSGCESVIDSLHQNRLFWAMCWMLSKRGGYYEFETRGVKDK